jgi:hypothetical protein
VGRGMILAPVPIRDLIVNVRCRGLFHWYLGLQCRHGRTGLSNVAVGGAFASPCTEEWPCPVQI